MDWLKGNDGKPLFSSKSVFFNFAVLVMCAQFAFSLLAMKGVLLPQMLELWDISKTQFGILMSIYGIVHNIFYIGFSWAQDRFSPRVLIPVNMIFGGLTTYFLGQTSNFAMLCFLFVMLSLWCEGAFWPAVLASVRKTTSNSNQGKIFGLLEGGRGCVELVQNTAVVGLYAYLGHSVLGLKLAFMGNACVMIVLGVISWFILPKETLLKSGGDSQKANKEVKEGMKTILKLPELWLGGLTGFVVFMSYTTMPFFLTFLKDVYILPVMAITIFGIASTSGGRITVALPAGFIADKFFGGPSGGMRAGLVAIAVLSVAMILLPKDPSYAMVAMILMMLMSFIFFYMRSLFFAPFGEMGIPQRFSGSAIAFAAFIIYLPATFAYGLWGTLLDAYQGAEGYNFLFVILLSIVCVGTLLATVLKRRIDNGASQRISEEMQRLDQRLGLEGEEKNLSDLIDNESKSEKLNEAKI